MVPTRWVPHVIVRSLFSLVPSPGLWFMVLSLCHELFQEFTRFTWCKTAFKRPPTFEPNQSA